MNGTSSRISAATWHGWYRTSLEIGLVLSLITVIGLIHAPVRVPQEFEALTVEQESVQMEEVWQTQQPEKPPPPPRALTPVAVPDEALPDEEPLNLDAGLDLDAELAIPSVPPPAEEPIVESAPDEPEIFVIVEEMPVIIGGIERLYEVVKYPEIAAKAGLEGMSVVQIVITEEGLPTDPVVTRSAGSVLDEAAIEAVMQLRFTPGRQRGRAVRVRLAIPIRFQLETL